MSEELTKEEYVQKLLDMNYRILLLLGYATSIICDYKRLEAYHDNSYKCEWLLQAIQAVVYDNKPIPKIPE